MLDPPYGKQLTTRISADAFYVDGDAEETGEEANDHRAGEPPLVGEAPPGVEAPPGGEAAFEVAVLQQFGLLTKLLDERFEKVEALIRSSGQGRTEGTRTATKGSNSSKGPSSGGVAKNSSMSAAWQTRSGSGSSTKPSMSIAGRTTTGRTTQPKIFEISEPLEAAAEEAQQLESNGERVERARHILDAGFFKSTKERFANTRSSSVISIAPWWVMRPSSTKRLAWDIAGMLFLIYDLLIIPLSLAFQPEASLFLTLMFWVIVSFWLMDIGMTCCTGFYFHGAEELSPSRIFCHYARTWMVFDFLVVTADFVAYFGDQMQVSTSKTMRLVRIVRALRLLRLIKLKKLTETLMDHIDSDYFHLLLGMLKGTMFVLGMNHLIACTWYGISTLASEGVDSWSRSASFDIEEGISYKYLTALHWSLTQFTPASMEVVPRNIHERAFAVCVLMFALLVFSSFVSSITASMTQLRQLSWKFTKDLSMLRKYLRAMEISGTLSIRILRFVEYKLEKNSNTIGEGDVKLLAILPPQLRMELVHETYSPVLVDHPFFHQISTTAGLVMQRLCNDAVSRVTFSMGDVVFEDRTKSDSMMFLTKGLAQYYSRYAKVRTPSTIATEGVSTLDKGEWCCEPALWTNWEHVGALHAVENSELLAISAAKLVVVVAETGLVVQETFLYGCKFLELLNDMSQTGRLTDLNSIDQEVMENIIEEAFSADGSIALEDGLASVTPNIFGRAHNRVSTFIFGAGRASSSVPSRRSKRSSSRSSTRGSKRSTFRVHRVSADSGATLAADHDLVEGATPAGVICSLNDASPAATQQDTSAYGSQGADSQPATGLNSGDDAGDDYAKRSL